MRQETASILLCGGGALCRCPSGEHEMRATRVVREIQSLPVPMFMYGPYGLTEVVEYGLVKLPKAPHQEFVFLAHNGWIRVTPTREMKRRWAEEEEFE